MSGQTPDLECPYVGLAPFEAAHADYFFGRALDSTVLADNVLARRITVLYGASGVGKSSVLNVGLPTALSELGVAARIVSRREWHEPGRLAGWLDGAIDAARATPVQPLIVILDQFEEYFLYADAEQIKDFARSLAAVVARRDVEAHLLFAVRDDGLHRLDALRLHLPGLLDTTLELRHLDESSVREAIEQPIAVWNQRHTPDVVLDDDFAEALIAQLRPKDANGQAVKGGRVELAYLQLALEKIWEAEGGATATALRTDTLTERLKGISEISRRHVEDVLSKLPEADQAVCATVFDRLVTPSGGKILYATTDLAAVAKVEPGRMGSVLAPLASGKTRILRTVELPGGKHAHGYEILHDILARPILDWRTKYQEAKERAEAVEHAAREAAGQEKEAAKRKAVRGLILGIVILASVSALATGAAFFAFNQRNQAEINRKKAEDNAKLAREREMEVRNAKEAEAARLQTFLKGIQLRQTILSGQSIPPNYINHEIRFHAEAKEYPYKSLAGKATYKFTISPDSSSIPGGLQSIAFITFRMAHPTFPNSLIATGPDRNFTASYDGVGCLNKVVALIEYTNPDTPPSVAEFNQCKLLKWE